MRNHSLFSQYKGDQTVRYSSKAKIQGAQSIMDKQQQEHFFRLLRQTYESATADEDVSIEKILAQIKSGLSDILKKLH